MADEFYMKAGDTLPTLDSTLLDPEDHPRDLTDATVHLHLRVPGATTPVLVDTATVLSGVNGTVRYTWPAPQALAPGIYQGEWQVTFEDGNVETFPNYGFFHVVIAEAVS
jgi:hypothetical protein